MRITRVYADASGGSHFEDVEIDLPAVDGAPSAALPRLSATVTTTQTLFVALPAGWRDGWHPAPRRQYWVGLQGTAEVTVGDGDVRQFGAGSVVLLEDVLGRGHVTRVVGDHDLLAMLVHL